MSTWVIYGNNADNVVCCIDPTYATARAGTGTLTLGTVTLTGLNVNVDGGNVGIGQRLGTISANPVCSEGFIAFDTSAVRSPTSATLEIYLSSDQSTTDFICEAREYDWGTDVATSDFVAGASLSSHTLAASIDTNGIGAIESYKAFTDVALVSVLNFGGFTRLLLNSSRHRIGNTPSGNEYISWYSSDATNPPKITLTDNSTQNSETKNSGDTSFTPTRTGLHDVELWGGGSGGGNGASQEPGGSGGAYSFAQYNISSLSAITIQVGSAGSSGGAGGDTWFNSSADPDPLAKGAGLSSGATVNGGGLAASGRGLVRFSGGSGAAQQGGGGNRAGSGGGSSAGTAANGVGGTAGSGSTIGPGGTAPTGGGDGGDGASRTVAAEAGTAPGGGGGGAADSVNGSQSGAAGKMIIYWYVTPAGITLPRIINRPYRLHQLGR